MRSKRVLPLFLLTLIVFSACGKSQIRTYPTSGKVQFSNHEPVRTGTIELESIEHHTTATGSIQPDGSFVLGTFSKSDGAAAGKHRVIVIQLVITDGSAHHSTDHGRAVPSRYSRYETSGLTAEVLPQKQNDLLVVVESGTKRK